MRKLRTTSTIEHTAGGTSH